MSQEKVNKYKNEKANRKEILKKERYKKNALRVAGGLICLAIIGWIGFSVYDSTAKKAAAAQTEIHLDAITNYISGLSAENTAAE